MQTYKTTGGLVEILEIYLTDGKQRAKIGDWSSSDLHVKTGAPRSPCRIFSPVICKKGGGVIGQFLTDYPQNSYIVLWGNGG